MTSQENGLFDREFDFFSFLWYTLHKSETSKDWEQD